MYSAIDPEAGADIIKSCSPLGGTGFSCGAVGGGDVDDDPAEIFLSTSIKGTRFPQSTRLVQSFKRD